MVRSIGADHVIDYTKEDFTRSGQNYDVIIDNVGNHSMLECRRVLNPKGKYVLIGGGGVNDSPWIGPLASVIKGLVLAPFVSQDMGMMLADLNQKDLTALGDLIQTGKVTPVIDRLYPLRDLPAAIRYLEKGHARGKVIIMVGDKNEIPPIVGNPSASSASTIPPTLIIFAVIALVLIAPIVLALVFNRRFQQGNPGKRPYRWGYYFSMMTIVGGLILGLMLEAGSGAVIVCGLIYAVLAWFFAQRHHWAWITLTILSFNPVAWIINGIYLWKRWAEGAVATS